MREEPRNPRDEFTIKAIVVGDEDVGKSALVTRAIFNRFDSYSAVFGAIGYDKKCSIEDRPVTLRLWDTGNVSRRDKFSALMNESARGATLIFVVYGVTNEASFQSAERYLNLSYTRFPDAQIILMGNKSEGEKQAVTDGQGQELARRYGIPFYTVSAKTGNNVQVAILDGTTRAYQKNRPKPVAAAPQSSSLLQSVRQFFKRADSPPVEAGRAEKKEEQHKAPIVMEEIDNFRALFGRMAANQLTDKHVETLQDRGMHLFAVTEGASAFVSAYRDTIWAEYLLTHHVYPGSTLKKHGIAPESRCFRFTHLQPAAAAWRNALNVFKDPSLTEAERDRLGSQLMKMYFITKDFVGEIPRDARKRSVDEQVMRSLKLASIPYRVETEDDIVAQIQTLDMLADRGRELFAPPGQRSDLEKARLARARARRLPVVPNEEKSDDMLPNEFLCPITKKLMEKPVTLEPWGTVCDHEAAVQWLREYDWQDPITREKVTGIEPNRELKAAIDQWKVAHPAVLAEAAAAPAVLELELEPNLDLQQVEAADQDVLEEKREELPEEFICPLALVLMEDPVTVLASDGRNRSAQTYERQAIEDWMKKSRIDPMTQMEIIDKTLRPNEELRAAIAQWKTDHPRYVADQDPHVGPEVEVEQDVNLQRALLESVRAPMRAPHAEFFLPSAPGGPRMPDAFFPNPSSEFFKLEQPL